jgi:hypothetical protein
MKDIHVADEHEVVPGETCRRRRSRLKEAAALGVALNVVQRVFHVDAMLLQEGIDFDTRAETQQSAQLCVRQSARPIALQRQALEGRARQIGPLARQILGDVLGKVEDNRPLPSPLDRVGRWAAAWRDRMLVEGSFMIDPATPSTRGS